MSVGRSAGRSVGQSVGPSHFAFFAFSGILRIGKFVFEHAPAQIITAPSQLIIALAQPPATGVEFLQPIPFPLSKKGSNDVKYC